MNEPKKRIDVPHGLNAPERLGWIQKLASEFDPEEGLAAQLCIQNVLLEDGDPVVKHEAAFILGTLQKEKKIASECALQALLEASSDKSVLVRHEVALTLAHFPGTQAVSLLVKLARDPSEDVSLSAHYALVERDLS